MRLTMLGVRGSTPAPGGDYIRYGGHTSCVAITPVAAAAPTILLDAGTGVRDATAMLGGRPFEGAILLTHLHWDHMQGIPFFAAGDRADAEVSVYLPAQQNRSGAELLAGAMSPPAFPIGPADLLGQWSFHAVEAGAFGVGGCTVTAFDVEHKGGRTFGYRIDGDGGSVAYLPDRAADSPADPMLRSALNGVDVLIHDAQFLEDERPSAMAYGHSTIADAIALARQVRAQRLVLFHHAPGRSDTALDLVAAAHERDADPVVIVAAQGVTVQTGTRG